MHLLIFTFCVCKPWLQLYCRTNLISPVNVYLSNIFPFNIELISFARVSVLSPCASIYSAFTSFSLMFSAFMRFLSRPLEPLISNLLFPCCDPSLAYYLLEVFAAILFQSLHVDVKSIPKLLHCNVEPVEYIL